MKEKTRKILKRMGAGLLLGLSFLNFGTGWGKQKAKSIPRRAQNIRKTTQEELDSEIQQVADIAEEEAQDVINQVTQEQQQMQQMQLQAQTQTRSQQFLRYATVGGWGVAMAVFFTSMVFNTPFSLGKAVLSLLPGEPHVAVLSLQPQQDRMFVGDTVEVDLKLATNKEEVNYFKAVINYDPQVLRFKKMEIDRTKFDDPEKNKIDPQKGRIELIVKRKEGSSAFKKDTIAKIYFEAIADSPETQIALSQKESLVLKDKKGKKYNILGKVVAGKVKIHPKLVQEIKCQKLDIVGSRMNKAEWERLTKSAPIPLKDGGKWLSIPQSGFSLLCAYSDDGYLYFLFDNMNKQKINNVQFIHNTTGSKAKVEKTEEWSEGDRLFYSAIIKPDKWIKEKPGVYKGIIINVDLSSKTIRLPEKGSLEIFLTD